MKKEKVLEKGKIICAHSTGIPTQYREMFFRAKEEFCKRDGYLGMSFCKKREDKKDGKFCEKKDAIVVYVRKKITDKKKIKENQLIMGTFEAIPTDVVEVFSKDPKSHPRKHFNYLRDHHRSHDLSSLDYGIIHDEHLKQVKALPEIGMTGTLGDVFIIEDHEGRLITKENEVEIPDLVEAYKVFRKHHDDVFDFVTFFSDVETGMPSFDTSFHIGIHNDIKGIGLGEYDYRDKFGGSRTLQSIHFIHHTHLNRYVMLQEMGHRWCAFVGFKETGQGPTKYDLLIQEGAGAYDHWNRYFDDDFSPVDYDLFDWVENSDSTFSAIDIPHRNRKYCKLDLYLMGLLDQEQAGTFFYLQNSQQIDGRR